MTRVTINCQGQALGEYMDEKNTRKDFVFTFARGLLVMIFDQIELNHKISRDFGIAHDSSID